MALPAMPGEGPGAFRRFFLPGVFVAALFVVLFLRREDQPSQDSFWTFKGPTMGTAYTIKVVTDKSGDADARAATALAIDDTLKLVNQRMSTYIKDSELSSFNANASTDTTPISPELNTVVTEALRLSEISGGAFDVTVGPLVNAWGFGPGSPGSPPDEATLTSLREKVGYQKLSLNAQKRTLSKSHPGVYVDLSAIAKGFGVDEVARKLDSLGHSRYMVEVGGEVRTRGLNDRNQAWSIGIEKPDENARAIQEIIPLLNLSMATSGNYRNFYEKDGKRLSHTIDPRTGAPVTHRLASVSVLHKDCMSADGIATMLNVLGEKEGYKLAERENIAAFFLVKNKDGRFEEKATPAFEKLRKGAQSDPNTP